MATSKKAPVAKQVAWYDTPVLREYFGACPGGWEAAKKRFSKFDSANDWWKKARASSAAIDDMSWFLAATSRYCRNNGPYTRYCAAITGWRVGAKQPQGYPPVTDLMKIARTMYPDIPVSSATKARFPMVFQACCELQNVQ